MPGAKHMLWFMAHDANALSEKKDLGIRCQVIVPQQKVGGTGVGDAGANAYVSAQGLTPEAFLARFGAPMSPRDYGGKVVSVLPMLQAWASDSRVTPAFRYWKASAPERRIAAVDA
jgi:hypothetical protein